MSDRPVASLSLDLDNKWAYLRAAGDPDWQSRDSYLPVVIERIVDVVGEAALPLSVFIVGRDLDERQTDDAIAIDSFNRLKQWEPANHSLNHLPWMHTLNPNEIHDEIAVTHDRIVATTRRIPVGFRGPGFSCPDEVLGVLSRLQYTYDASIFPTSIAPLARAVFLARTKLCGEQREKAKKLYGGFASMRHPNRPHRRMVNVSNEGSDEHSIWEIPVTVMPFSRTPIHFSYLNFVAQQSVPLAKAYFRSALTICRRCNVPPSLLLHPLDFMGCEDDSDMTYFPGMKTPRAIKLRFMKWAMDQYAQRFDVQTISQQVTALTHA